MPLEEIILRKFFLGTTELQYANKIESVPSQSCTVLAALRGWTDKVKYMATQVAWEWAGAVMKLTNQAAGQEQ